MDEEAAAESDGFESEGSVLEVIGRIRLHGERRLVVVATMSVDSLVDVPRRVRVADDLGQEMMLAVELDRSTASGTLEAGQEMRLSLALQGPLPFEPTTVELPGIVIRIEP